MNSQGVVFAHNLFAGKMNMLVYDSRLTPYDLPHSTAVACLNDNPGGDVQFLNNLFVNGGDVNHYSNALLPVRFDGNVYTKGSVRAIGLISKRGNGELNKNANEQMKKYQEHKAVETNALVKDDFDAAINLLKQDKFTYVEIAFDKEWLTQKRKLITTPMLGKAVISNLPFENPDGSAIKIDTDYFGTRRNLSNPSPGPFEILNTGKQKIKVWDN